MPSKLQEFFLLHKEINVAEFAKRVGINATLMRNYVNGFKKTSAAREKEIVDAIHQLGLEYCCFSAVDGYKGHKDSSRQYLSDSEPPKYGAGKDSEK